MSPFITPLCILAASLFYVNEPVVDMRESPTHESKTVSQTIFSEDITVENEFEDWAYITTPDQYSGWIPTNSFVATNKPYNASLKVSRLAAHIYGVKDTEFGPIKTLPYGSQLQSLDETDPRWIKIALPDGKECYIQKGDVTSEHKLSNKEDLVAFSQKFLGLPYTWGGRSSFGYDCSGFVQMLYNQIDIALQRDSKLQVDDRRFQTVSMSDVEAGDLIFFGKSEQKISHVGMYLGNGQFIHSTVRECQPWIRVSNLSDFEWSGHKEATFPYRIFKQSITK
jgi:cell wall-associated NlpC family hydrolase